MINSVKPVTSINFPVMLHFISRKNITDFQNTIPYLLDSTMELSCSNAVRGKVLANYFVESKTEKNRRSFSDKRPVNIGAQRGPYGTPCRIYESQFPAPEVGLI